MQFYRLYFSVGQIEAAIWDFWSFGSSRALPDIWAGKTHLGSVLRCTCPRGPAISSPLRLRLTLKPKHQGQVRCFNSQSVCGRMRHYQNILSPCYTVDKMGFRQLFSTRAEKNIWGHCLVTTMVGKGHYFAAFDCPTLEKKSEKITWVLDIKELEKIRPKFWTDLLTM